MHADEYSQEIEDFNEVLEQPPDRRDAFIEERHAGDPAMIERLRRLLAGHDDAAQTVHHTAAFSGGLRPGEPEQTPSRIGPYRLLERLGEGGMGVVHAAEQTEPIRRRVAIKVIKLGMDTEEVVARFQAERQALAMLDHPCIAKVFDAGSTETGRPYFVMELVKGVPLTEYCQTHRLTIPERLRLFVQVCQAIQHAHQRGILHRDLKPSNVLVAAPEGDPVPKVIDFGVAKAMISRLSDRTLFTEQGRLIGTPEYMSPEQAEMTGMDVDTRSDVYSLGVMLYELLAGVLPFDPKELRSGGFEGIRRTIREVDPVRPSERLAQLVRAGAGGADGAARARARAIRGELDWIVMCAVDKDRTRRYGTASALCDDLERYLAGMPVVAGSPNAAYRLRKFVRRHRYTTAATCVALVTVFAGIMGLSIGLIDAREATLLAERRADHAQAAADFLEQVLFQADPEFGGRSLTLGEVHEMAAMVIDEELGAFPEVEASVRESMGVAFRRRSEFAKAEPHLRKSLAIRQDLFGEDALETAPSLIAMASLHDEYEGDVAEAPRKLNQAYEGYVVNGLAGTVAEAWLQLDIGLISLTGDRLAAAEAAFTVCRTRLAADRGAEHPDVSRAVRGLAMVALRRGDRPSAERLADLAVAISASEGVEYLNARARLVLAEVLLETDRVDEVPGLLSGVRDQLRRTVGDRHVRLAELDACLAALHLRTGAFAEAEEAAARCEASRRELMTADHWAILEARLLRQRARIGLGDAQAAEAELLQIGELVERRLGPGHPLAIRVAAARAECARALGDDQLATIRDERVAGLEARRAARLRAAGGTG